MQIEVCIHYSLVNSHKLIKCTIIYHSLCSDIFFTKASKLCELKKIEGQLFDICVLNIIFIAIYYYTTKESNAFHVKRKKYL